MTTINVSASVDKSVKFLDSFRKQIPFAVSVALNKTAIKVRDKEKHEITDVFDRPTPFITNSVFVKPSNKVNLTAKVGIKDQGRVPASKVLAAQISGGSRRNKAFENALVAAGAIPSGYYIVPGEGADIDQYGNVKGQQIRQILSYFRANKEAGYISNSTEKTRAKLKKGTKKKAGISYFVGRVGRSPLGIWRRNHSGAFVGAVKPIQPILMLMPSVRYEKNFDFLFVAETAIKREFESEFEKAMAYAISTAK